MLNYRSAFKELSNAKQGFFAPDADRAQQYLKSEFARDPIGFKNQNSAEGKLQNKVGKRATPIGDYPKFRAGREKTPVAYPD